mgnify:CR=1 FL=1
MGMYLKSNNFIIYVKFFFKFYFTSKWFTNTITYVFANFWTRVLYVEQSRIRSNKIFTL